MKKKLPLIFQTDPSECGLAVLAMILHYYGFQCTLSELQNDFLYTMHGMSIADIVSLAKKYKLSPTVLRIEENQIHSLKTPSILHWDMNHYVVLIRIKKNHFVIYDPAKGKRHVNRGEFLTSFTGIAVECVPDSAFLKKTSKKNKTFYDILKKIPDFKSTFCKIGIFFLSCQILVLFMPAYSKLMLDKAKDLHIQDRLFLIFLSYACLHTLLVLSSILRKICVKYIETRFSFLLAKKLFDSLLSLPYTYFQNRVSGEIIYRFNSIDQIRQLLSNDVIESIWHLLMLPSCMIIMLLMSFKLALVSIFFSIIFMPISWYFLDKSKKRTLSLIAAKAEQQFFLEETIRSSLPIRLFQQKNSRLIQWGKKYNSYLYSSSDLSLNQLVSTYFREFIFGIEFLMIILLGTHLINHQLSFGVFYSFLFYRFLFIGSMGSIFSHLNDFKRLFLYMDRLAVYFEHSSVDERLHVKLPSCFSLSTLNLAFKYHEKDKFIFSNVSFFINEGEFVVLTGKNASGKSTLLKVLAGLLKPTIGSVMIGDVMLDDIPEKDRLITSVMQNDGLLHGTILQNISFFSDNEDIERIMYIAQLLGLYDEVMALPMKFNSMIINTGSCLSAGQLQRICIARALYSQPRIILLDDTTCFLDRQGQQLVNSAIRSLGITCIIVAQSEQTLRVADQVISL